MENWHENDMLDKLLLLLDSPEPEQIELAYQLMFGMGIPFQERYITQKLTNTGYKIGFCLRYGFLEYIQHIEKLYLKDFYGEISPLIGQLKHLQEIEIRCSKMEVLPAQIGYLRKLWRLDLENNALQNLPEEIGYLRNLVYLNVSHNALQNLPTNIGDLHNLRTLKLDYNELVALPEDITQLHALEALDLSHNRLISLPAHIWELPRLTYLFLSGNPLAPEEVQELRKKMKNKRLFF
jgi:Leucine-rich repeat (LRR) protein